MTSIIQVELPASLCLLAGIRYHLHVSIAGPITQRSVLDRLEADFPALDGTIRDHTTRLRRPFIRFFACGEDLSHSSPDDPLPAAVANGSEPFLIIGAIAGG